MLPVRALTSTSPLLRRCLLTGPTAQQAVRAFASRPQMMRRNTWDPFYDVDRMMREMERNLMQDMQDFFPTRAHPCDRVARAQQQQLRQQQAVPQAQQQQQQQQQAQEDTSVAEEKATDKMTAETATQQQQQVQAQGQESTSVEQRRQQQEEDMSLDMFPFGGELGWPFMSRALRRSAPRAPPLEIEETENEYKVHMTVPGYNKEQIKVNITGTGDNRMLTISGEINEETKDEKRGYARKYGSFSRSMSLPASIKADGVTGKMENGVLEVTLPKDKEHEAERAKVQTVSIQ